MNSLARHGGVLHRTESFVARLCGPLAISMAIAWLGSPAQAQTCADKSCHGRPATICLVNVGGGNTQIVGGPNNGVNYVEGVTAIEGTAGNDVIVAGSGGAP